MLLISCLPLANHVSNVVGKKISPFQQQSVCKLHPELSHDDLANVTRALWPQGPTTVISSAFHQSSSAPCNRHSILEYSCSLKPRTPVLHPLLPICKRLSNRKLTPLFTQTLSSSSWVNREAWLMFTMQAANIWGILPNAFAEVIPKIVIRQFLRAIHVLKRHFLQWHHWWVFHLLNVYIFNTYRVPGTALSAKDGVVTRVEKASTFPDLTIGSGVGAGGGNIMNKLMNQSSNGEKCFNNNKTECSDPEWLGVGCWWWITVDNIVLDSGRSLWESDVLLRLNPGKLCKD